MKLLTLKLMVAVAFIASSSSALAQWTLLDDFEARSIGELTGQGNWTVTNPDIYEVADDLLGPGNKVLYVPTGTESGGPSAGSNNASIPLPGGIADGTTGTAFFRMSIGQNDAPVGNGTAGGDFVFGSSAFATPEGWNNYKGYMVMAGGNIRVRNGNTGFTTVGNYVPDEWYNYWLVLDNDTDTTSLYSSQGTDPAVLLGTGPFRNNSTPTTENDPLLTLNLRIGEFLDDTDGQLDSIYFDPNGVNLSNPIPEPGTIALAFGACLLAAGARRRSS